MQGSEVDWTLAVRAIGAACARGALVAEIMGTTQIPEGCDPLADAFPDQETTYLLVWTLKAKTVANPIGNEEHLLNSARKGALVDLRCAPHEAVLVRRDGVVVPFRLEGERTSEERAFGDVGNFVTDASGRGIPGNEGAPWPSRDKAGWV